MPAHYEFGPPIESTSVVSIYRGSRVGAHGFARPVTLSVAHPELSREQAFSRAFFEAGACFAHLSNAQVLDVEEVVEEHGRLFAVSPAMTGRSLARLVECPPGRATALSPRFACDVVLSVADSVGKVGKALGQGSWLGGVSAEAVWLGERGDVVLLPTALCASKVPPRCRKGPVARYRAPELDRVRAGGPSADVYSLGLLLWDLLAQGRAAAPRDLGDATCLANRAIDASVVGLVMRCLSPRPGDRPSDAAAFAVELLGCVRGSTAGERPDSTVDIRTDELQCIASRPVYDVAKPDVRHVSDFRMRPRPEIPRPAPARKGASAAKSASFDPRLVGRDGSRLRLMDSGSRWVVGRGRSADLVAADPDMSRAHFEVVRGLDGAFRVRDLGSKNGLYVNGLRAKTATLRPGDELMAGGTVLRFER